MTGRPRAYQLLLIVGIVAVSCGCIGAPAESTPGADSVGEPEESAGSATATATPSLMPQSDPIRTFDIGNESTLPPGIDRHDYQIVNAQFRSGPDLNLTIVVRRNGSIVFQRRATLPPQRHVRIRTYVTGNYTIEVTPEEHPRRAFRSPWREWDCNYARFDMILRPNGSWSTTGIKTVVGCETPATPSTDPIETRVDCETPTATSTDLIRTRVECGTPTPTAR